MKRKQTTARSEEFMQNLLATTCASWKWPQYKQAIAADIFVTEAQPDSKRKNSGFLVEAAKNAGLQQLRKLLSASFVEWKYYSVLTQAFHGIIGFSFYNPEQKFERAAEGGLLLVVAGNIGPKQSQMVYMKLFPESALIYSSSNNFKGKHGSVSFEILDDSCKASIRISDAEGFDLCCVVEGDNPTSPWHPRPLVDTQLNPLPGGHWIVHNRIPVGQSSGKISMSRNFIECLRVQGTCSSATPGLMGRPNGLDANSYWLEKSSQLEKIPETNIWEWKDAPAYFEHSYGLHPLTSQGWDFFFAPLEGCFGGAVLQSYKNSMSLKQLDIFWIDQETNEKRSTSFSGDNLKIEWHEKEYDRKLKAWIPIERRLHAANESYSVQLTQRIHSTLRFLRPQTLAVRCFFIGEQIGTASWTLRDKHGKEIQKITNTLAGGEVAYWRFPSLGKHTQPFPV